MSARREEQAFNDGRLAYRYGKGMESCGRRSAEQRAKWLEGYEHERRLDRAAEATDEQRAEAASVLQRLKDFAATL